MSGKLNERELVENLIRYLKRNEKNRIYVYVDRDPPSLRHIRSGWDFLVAKNGQVVFCEAKVRKAKLTDWQTLVQTENILAGNEYVVLRFFDDDIVVNETTRKKIKIEEVSFDFLAGGRRVKSNFA